MSSSQEARVDIKRVCLIQAFEIKDALIGKSEITDECHEETVLQVAVVTCVIEH
jgi:hypothetical protein